MSQSISANSLNWTVALTMALALHSSLAWWFLQNRGVPNIGGAVGQGDQGLEVGLGMRGSYALLQDRMKADEPKPVIEPDPAPIEHKPEPVQPVKEMTAHPVETDIPEPAAAKSPNPVVKNIIPETKVVPDVATADYQIAEPQPETIDADKETDKTPDILQQQTETLSETAQIETQESAEKTKNNVTSSQKSILATGIAERVQTGGNPAARQSYLNKVLAHIARYKRYPRAARHDGVTGVVTVTFTVLANGRVSTQLISSSSGDARLDQAALDMLLRASPLAPIPREMGTDQLKLTLPVEFSLNKKRTLF